MCKVSTMNQMSDVESLAGELLKQEKRNKRKIMNILKKKRQEYIEQINHDFNHIERKVEKLFDNRQNIIRKITADKQKEEKTLTSLAKCLGKNVDVVFDKFFINCKIMGGIDEQKNSLNSNKDCAYKEVTSL